MRHSSKRSPWLAALSVLLVGLVVVIAMAAALVPSLLPAGDRIGGEGRGVAAGAIFVGCYLALAIGRIPGLSIDRAGIALVGASLMVASGALPLEGAYKAIDLDTITLLLGMMIVVANLRLSGFFAVATAWVTERAKAPLILLGGVVGTSGIFSAFLVNDAICLVLAPLVLELTLALGRNPVPYLLAVAMASNIGSTATITGNPQNIMIGSFSQIPYAEFSAALSPIAAVGLSFTLLLIVVLFPGEFWTRERSHAQPLAKHVHPALLIKSVGITAVMVAACFAGLPPAKAALISGALLLLTRRVKSEKVYNRIDWTLLLMFMGLFIVVAGFEKAVLTPEVIHAVAGLHLDRLPLLSLVTAVLSNLVSNVPAVLVLKPFVASLADPESAWLTVAMSSTLAGNLTIVGSVANLIVVQIARTHGVSIGFWDYAKVGAPLTLLTISFGVVWLQFM